MPAVIFFACLDLDQKSSFLDGHYLKTTSENGRVALDTIGVPGTVALAAIFRRPSETIRFAFIPLNASNKCRDVDKLFFPALSFDSVRYSGNLLGHGDHRGFNFAALIDH